MPVKILSNKYDTLLGMNVFDEVIDGLESKGAFKDVPRRPETNIELDFTSAKPAGSPSISFKFIVFRNEGLVTQDLTDWQFRSIHIGFKAYRPDKVFMPWYRNYAQGAMHRPLTRKTMFLMDKNMRGVDQAIRFLESDDRTLSSIRMTQSEQHEDLIRLKNLKKIVQHHPQLLIAITLFQKANLDFLYQVGLRIRNTNSLNPDQKKIAADAIENLTHATAQDNFLVSLGAAIADTYHKRAQGDYTQPIAAEDFTKSWQDFVDGNGFKTRVENADETVVTIRCPFQPSGTRQSAVEVGGEVCQAPSSHRDAHASMGYGLWCVYAQLNKSPLARIHRMQTAIAQWKLSEKFGKKFAQHVEDYIGNPIKDPVSALCATIRLDAEVATNPIRRILRNVVAVRYTVQGALPKYNR